jgi:hypothetical protein
MAYDLEALSQPDPILFRDRFCDLRDGQSLVVYSGPPSVIARKRDNSVRLFLEDVAFLEFKHSNFVAIWWERLDKRQLAIALALYNRFLWPLHIQFDLQGDLRIIGLPSGLSIGQWFFNGSAELIAKRQRKLDEIYQIQIYGLPPEQFQQAKDACIEYAERYSQILMAGEPPTGSCQDCWTRVAQLRRKSSQPPEPNPRHMIKHISHQEGDYPIQILRLARRYTNLNHSRLARTFLGEAEIGYSGGVAHPLVLNDQVRQHVASLLKDSLQMTVLAMAGLAPWPTKETLIQQYFDREPEISNVSANTWHHAAGVLHSASLRNAYISGGNDEPNISE